ncbi:MAG: bifunctional glutamate N-acetyltransferase/amino-acid acetyltransferase ArgJ [Litorivicinaceae bacterium]|nr:MAG: bifunctional glutamate N-acetyltransferase/amino-acid acetyltransferase ArgJ [Litorivicinaceae bacterium]CAI8308765.1 MAG: Arginine biosynthesis bifunctional protein ArgJ [Gammaproteobacteria bacterium]
MKSSDGGLPVSGVQLGAVSASVYEDRGRDDLLLMAFDEGSIGACVTTMNQFCAAPVHVLKAHLESTPYIRYWLINAGNANAGTGELGMEACRQIVSSLASLTDVSDDAIWPFSTGIIGEPLPVQSICDAIPRALNVCDSSIDAWERASRAIMTTDTHPKLRHIQCEIRGKTVTLTGMAKGSGMIHPNMATMFGLIASDVVMTAECLHTLLGYAVNHSFNCVTVDGDTSTNDACAIVATQVSGHETISDPASLEAQIFASALSILADDLAEMLARDGEGATKFVRVICEDAASDEDARAIANTVALSPLVKTALAASDPNWGRIVAAVGRAPVSKMAIDRVNVWINDVQVVENGGRHPEYTEEAGQAAMNPVDIDIRISMGVGSGHCRVMTCDLTKEYVRINAEYRT